MITHVKIHLIAPRDKCDSAAETAITKEPADHRPMTDNSLAVRNDQPSDTAVALKTDMVSSTDIKDTHLQDNGMDLNDNLWPFPFPEEPSDSWTEGGYGLSSLTLSFMYIHDKPHPL